MNKNWSRFYLKDELREMRERASEGGFFLYYDFIMKVDPEMYCEDMMILSYLIDSEGVFFNSYEKDGLYFFELTDKLAQEALHCKNKSMFKNCMEKLIEKELVFKDLNGQCRPNYYALNYDKIEQMFFDYIDVRKSVSRNSQRHSENFTTRLEKINNAVYRNSQLGSENLTTIQSISKDNKGIQSNTDIEENPTEEIQGADFREEAINSNKNKAPAPKHHYGDYGHVMLDDKQLEALQSEFPSSWQEWIARVDNYCEAKGTSYKNYLQTIRNWSAKDNKNKYQPNEPKPSTTTREEILNNLTGEVY